jgi:hypothetical protein
MMVMIIICIPYEKGRGGNLMTRVGVDLKTEGGPYIDSNGKSDVKSW